MFHLHKIIKTFTREKLQLAKTETPFRSTEIPMISPKGLYSNPKDETGIVLSQGGIKYLIPLQKSVELKEKDVRLTNDKNYVHLAYEDEKIVIKGDTVFEDGVTIKGSLEVEGDIKVKGEVTVDKTIKATGDIQSEKDIKATGNMEATGRVKGTTVEGTADVKAGQISVVGHTHLSTDTNGPVTSNVPTSAPIPTG